MAGIKDLREHQARMEAERPQGGGMNLYPREGDLVFFHFISSGEDDDPYMEVFGSHELPPQREGQYSSLKFCPKSLDATAELPCPLCVQDIKIKDRMMMYLWVHEILRTQLKQGEQLETVLYNNRNYFKQPVNALRLWDTSAWRESPLSDILYLGEQLGNLRTIQMNLVCTGGGIERRYKVHVIPNSGGLPDELLEKAKLEARPIIEMLKEELAGTETVRRPAATTAPAQTPAPTVTAYTPPSFAPAVATPAPAAALVAEASAAPPDEDVPPEELF